MTNPTTTIPSERSRLFDELRRGLTEAFDEHPQLAGATVEIEPNGAALAVEVNGIGGRRRCVLDGVADAETPTLETLFTLSHRQHELGATRAVLMSRVGFPVDVMTAAGSLGVDLFVFERREESTPDGPPAFFRVTGPTTLEGVKLGHWLAEVSKAPLERASDLVS